MRPRVIKRIGGEENAFTSHDYTAYHQTVVSDRLEVVMELEARRMARLEVLAGGPRDRAQGGARGTVRAGCEQRRRPVPRTGQCRNLACLSRTACR